MADSETRARVAWLARRVGWGLALGELDELVALGTEVVLDRLVDPSAAGVAGERSPWADIDYSDDPDKRREEGLATLAAWVEHLATTDRPFENSLAWFWHDHFAVSYGVVNHLPTFVAHLELLRAEAGGSFARLIRRVTTDAAMLMFLDGRTSTGASPNENYGRELLELYTLGIGNYSEDDVRAASVALTGWVVRPRLGWTVEFIPFRHDDTAQQFLGVEGVHDVDTVVAAAVADAAVPGFISAKFANHYLGTVDKETTDALAATFSAADLDIATLGRAVLEAGLDGAGSPQIVGPVPWMIHIMRATGARPEAPAMIGLLRAMGQVPGIPPNVGGYPSPSAWVSSSSTAARFTAANGLARLTPDDAPALALAASGEWDGLADLLLRPTGFVSPTLDALRDLPASTSRRRGEAALALAFASPDLLIA